MLNMPKVIRKNSNWHDQEGGVKLQIVFLWEERQAKN
jgi:hypothetical protein